MQNCRCVLAGSNCFGPIARSMTTRASRTSGAISSARVVGSIPAAVRTNRSSSRNARRRDRAWLTADGLRLIASLARRTFRSRRIASNTRSKFRSRLLIAIALPLHQQSVQVLCRRMSSGRVGASSGETSARKCITLLPSKFTLGPMGAIMPVLVLGSLYTRSLAAYQTQPAE
jgi:hypothetical protein